MFVSCTPADYFVALPLKAAAVVIVFDNINHSKTFNI